MKKAHPDVVRYFSALNADQIMAFFCFSPATNPKHHTALIQLLTMLPVELMVAVVSKLGRDTAIKIANAHPDLANRNALATLFTQRLSPPLSQSAPVPPISPVRAPDKSFGSASTKPMSPSPVPATPPVMPVPFILLLLYLIF